MRLDKLVSNVGNVSRQEARKRILAGAVTVDGEVVTEIDRKVDEHAALVCLDGERLTYRQFCYFMMDKPAGVLTATTDRDQKTVLDLLPDQLRRLKLVPAGRLDKDTTGLLILTNDGDYVHRVISPRHHVPKVYYAETEGLPTEADIARFAGGLTLGDGTKCLPARLEILPEQGACRVTVREGKYHMVRRMLAACGTPVVTLRRLSIGALHLDNLLRPGGFRELSDAEVQAVFMDAMPQN